MAALGIDLGTTHTVVATVHEGRVRVLADAEGERLLPSVVSFPAAGPPLVGRSARARRLTDARNTVFSVKRLIGRAWTSPEVSEARLRYPFELRESRGRGPLVVARGNEYTLPEISALVLRRARAIAEEALGVETSRAVITVPASFHELQRAATKLAGRVAGLEVIRILNEPTAAALAYGLGRRDRERVAVYDFGGGTFDCTLLELAGSVFEVLATSGDSFLGGDDLDTLIAERMSAAFHKAHGFDPRRESDTFERLRLAAEGLKHELSQEEVASVLVEERAASGVTYELVYTLTRRELEALAHPLVERTLAVTREALALAALPASAFDTVVLVGGSTRMPLVRRSVELLFGKAPRSEINPDEVVALGAAVQAAALTSPRRPSIPLPPHGGAAAVPPAPDSTGEVLPNLDFRPLAPPMDEAPSPTAAAEGALGPDDTIPYGVSAQAVNEAVGEEVPAPPLAAERRNAAEPPLAPPSEPTAPMFRASQAPVLVDVTPRALVVETAGGFCDVVVPRNARIPCECVRVFTTATPNQRAVRVRVAQGEFELFESNTFVGEVELAGLRPAPRGEVTIHVTFHLDASGLLRVHARDVGTGLETEAILELAGAPREESVARMLVRQSHELAEGP